MQSKRLRIKNVPGGGPHARPPLRSLFILLFFLKDIPQMQSKPFRIQNFPGGPNPPFRITCTLNISHPVSQMQSKPLRIQNFPGGGPPNPPFRITFNISQGYTKLCLSKYSWGSTPRPPSQESLYLSILSQCYTSDAI